MRSIALLFLLMPFFGWSQNLVPNPSFEEYVECPVSLAELQTQTNWDSWQESPDYFCMCNNQTNGSVGVPQNVLGYQSSISGDAYSGLATYYDVDLNVREYMAIQLLEPLVIGQTYYIFFYANQIEGETGTVPMELRCATNHIGLRFFKDPSYNNTDNIFEPDNFAHLDYSQVLADSDNWIKVEGWFIADDNYNWLAIGNFFDDAQTEILVQNEFGNCLGYYFIENVCVASDPGDCDYLVSNQELNAKPKINIFPNPTEDYFTIESTIIRLAHILVYNSLGELKLTESLTGKTKEMDISSWSKGLYQIVIKDENNSIKTFKILKQ